MLASSHGLWHWEARYIHVVCLCLLLCKHKASPQLTRILLRVPVKTTGDAAGDDGNQGPLSPGWERLQSNASGLILPSQPPVLPGGLRDTRREDMSGACISVLSAFFLYVSSVSISRARVLQTHVWKGTMEAARH